MPRLKTLVYPGSSAPDIKPIAMNFSTSADFKLRLVMVVSKASVEDSMLVEQELTGTGCDFLPVVRAAPTTAPMITTVAPAPPIATGTTHFEAATLTITLPFDFASMPSDFSNQVYLNFFNLCCNSLEFRASGLQFYVLSVLPGSVVITVAVAPTDLTEGSRGMG